MPKPQSTAGGPDTALLTYATSSDPQPLAAGETGSVTLAAGLITTPVYCDKILVIVKVGSDPDCLFDEVPTGSVVPSTWSVEPAQIATGTSLGLDDGDYATIKFYTVDPGACEIDYPLTLTLTGMVGNGPGRVFPIHIQENSGTTATGLSKHAGAVGVESGTAPFYLANFVATANGAPLLPCTEFTNGAAVRLSWESNGDRYALWRKGETAPFWTGVETTCSFAGPATDTTYFLIATSPDPDVTGPLYDTLTLTITNPDLTPKSVEIGSGNAANPYPAILDVRDGWTRIGCFNTGFTHAIPESSLLGGMVVAWNRSSGLAETNLYNVYPDAPQSFVFTQIHGTGSADLLKIDRTGVTAAGLLTVLGGASVTGAVTATGPVSGASFTLGGWTISVGANNSLVFTSPTGAVVSFDGAGNIVAPGNVTAAGTVAAGAITTTGTVAATGIITTNGAQVISAANVIYLSNDQGFLNGTQKVGGPGNGWNAAAYWQGDNPPDGDSNLNITIVS
ncbi:MAG: hypothetical protein ABWX67_00935 [Allosphingosinicella sp.]